MYSLRMSRGRGEGDSCAYKEILWAVGGCDISVVDERN
jgi:hypothetical protein